MITVDVTTTNYLVTATESVYPITVTADNSIFTITNVQQNFTVTNVTPSITFTADGGGASSWLEYLTVTNVLRVGVPGTTTGTFYINGLQYPEDKGTYGQVLYTNGTSTAAWVNLGELVFWQLSEDLQTVGYNIVTGSGFDDPNPQLTIGSGPTLAGNNTSTFKSFIKFDAVDGAQQLGNITVKGNTLFYNTVTFARALSAPALTVTGSSTLNGLTAGASTLASLYVPGSSTLNGTLSVSSGTTLNTLALNQISLSGSGGKSNLGGLIDFGAGLKRFLDDVQFLDSVIFSLDASFGNIVNFNENIYLDTDKVFYGVDFATETPGPISVSPGIRFPDGTVLTTAIPAGSGIVTGGTGLSTSTGAYGVVVNLNSATSYEIGGVRVSLGSRISIDHLGAISVKSASTSQHGTVQIGEFLEIGINGLLTVNTATLNQFIEIPEATRDRIGGVRVGSGLDINSGLLSLATATSTTIGGIKAGAGLDINTMTAVLQVATASSSTIGGVKIGQGLVINSSTSVLTLDGATTSTIGGVKVGDYLSINASTDVLTVNTATLGPVLASNFSYTLPIATTTTLGGIIVGNYLDINSSTGVLSVNTASLQSAVIPIASDTLLGGVRIPASGPITINTTTGDISVPFATKGDPVNVGTPGVVRIGNNLVDAGSGIIDVPIAGASSLGVVKPGFGMTNIGGALNVNTATTAHAGLVRIGGGIAIDSNATISIDPWWPIHVVELYEPLHTNGHVIRHNQTYPDVLLDLNTNNLQLQINTQTYMSMTGTTVVISTPNTSTAQVLIQTPELIVGNDIYNSQVQASAYYDFSGTGAAFFPANIKFSDDTIQRTAWRGYDQGLIV